MIKTKPRFVGEYANDVLKRKPFAETEIEKIIRGYNRGLYTIDDAMSEIVRIGRYYRV